MIHPEKGWAYDTPREGTSREGICVRYTSRRDVRMIHPEKGYAYDTPREGMCVRYTQKGRDATPLHSS